MKGKITAVFLTVVLLISAAAIPASAYRDTDTETYYRSHLTDDLSRVIYDDLQSVGSAQAESGVVIDLDDPITCTVYLTDLSNAGAQIKASSAYAAMTGGISSDVCAAFFALLYDHPELFWMDGYNYSISASVSVTSRGATYAALVKISEISLNFSNLSSYTDYGSLSYLDGLQAGGLSKFYSTFSPAIADMPRYLQVSAIHDYVDSVVAYNNADKNNPFYHDAVSAYYDGSGVCETYAKLFKLCCEMFDIPCVLVSGYASSGGLNTGSIDTHMWDEVMMDDGKWYAVDCTWDDAGNGSYSYMLVGSDTSNSGIAFKDSHNEDTSVISTSAGLSQFVFPQIEESAYYYDEGPAATSAPDTTSRKSTTQTRAATTADIPVITVSLNTAPAVTTTRKTATTVTHTSAAPTTRTPTTTAPVTTQKDEDKLGTASCDIDGDGAVTSADARLALRYSIDLEFLSQTQCRAADADGDSKITSADARLILRRALGLV